MYWLCTGLSTASVEKNRAPLIRLEFQSAGVRLPGSIRAINGAFTQACDGARGRDCHPFVIFHFVKSGAKLLRIISFANCVNIRHSEKKAFFRGLAAILLSFSTILSTDYVGNTKKWRSLALSPSRSVNPCPGGKSCKQPKALPLKGFSVFS